MDALDQIKLTYNYDHSCYYDENNKIRFDPPVYEQRYLIVLRLLELEFWKQNFKKIVEFGCAEMKFFTLLKTVPGVRQILQVDIDEELLTKWNHSVRPLFMEYIQRRLTELSVEVWRGSISAFHECLKDTDVVIGIEIIEHLFPEVLEGVPHNVFGCIRPKVAMFSTPNSEYNVHFDGLLENGFRHEDHKFEWTRAQFREWCEHICQRYPDYTVKYFGIGPPPKNSADVGYVSQLAVFVRKDFLQTLVAATVEQHANENEEHTVANGNEENAVASGNEEHAVANRNEGNAAASVPESAEGSINEEAEKVPKMYFDEDVGEIVMVREESEEAVEASVEGTNAPVCANDFDDNDLLHEEADISSDHDEPNGRDIDFYIPIERSRNDSGNYDDEPLDPSSDEYKLLYTVDYPVVEPDIRNRSQKLTDDAMYQIRKLRYNNEDQFYNYEDHLYRIPLQLVIDCMSLTTNIEELKPILVNVLLQISDDNIIVLQGDESGSESEEDFEYDLNEGSPHGEDNDHPQGPVNAKNDESNKEVAFQNDVELWD
ncbi:uncharacterized protein LOC128738914 [Sabethes cyaneus]|uniref:uncharacterized protein LOC128738914 n=1 Tax=Sabethes cyaneus TaxID=53552 RepID=UPI00237E6563|nr:uncharacterized protein LOC128738914 [Sabethes cyaneus]